MDSKLLTVVVHLSWVETIEEIYLLRKYVTFWSAKMTRCEEFFSGGGDSHLFYFIQPSYPYFEPCWASQIGELASLGRQPYIDRVPYFYPELKAYFSYSHANMDTFDQSYKHPTNNSVTVFSSWQKLTKDLLRGHSLIT